MLRLSALCIIPLCVLLVACQPDRYELGEDGAGRTIRLDKQTGEISVLQGNELVTVKDEKERQAEDESLAEVKFWGDIELKQIGVDQANLATYWREGSLYYDFSLKPYSKELQEARTEFGSQVTIIFRELKSSFVGDNTGIARFTVLELPLSLGQMSRTVDQERQPTGLSAAGSVACSAETYSRITSYTIQWLF